jgi:hypothetical protein
MGVNNEKSGLSFAKHTHNIVHIMKEKQTNLIAQLAGLFMLAVAFLLTGHDAKAQVAYNDAITLVTNGTQPVLLQFNNANQIGDEIVLDPGLGNPPANAVVVPGVSTNVLITNFTFEYYLNETDKKNGSFTYPKWTVDLRFYAMNTNTVGGGVLVNTNGILYGTNYNAPGTLLYDSGVQTIPAGVAGDEGFENMTFSVGNTMIKNGGVLVPLDFTWTVSFGGAALESTNLIGLPIFTNDVAGLVGTTSPDFWEDVGTNYVYTNTSDTPAFVYSNIWIQVADATNLPMDFGSEVLSSSDAGSTVPTAAITGPANKFVDSSNNVLTVLGTATLKSKIGNDYIAAVKWQLFTNGLLSPNGWNDATLTAGGTLTNWTASVTLPATGMGAGGVYGTTNEFAVEAYDAAGDVSIIHSNSYIFVSTNNATLTVVGAGTAAYGSGKSAVAFEIGQSGPIGPLIIGKQYTIAVTQTNDTPISYYFSTIDDAYNDPISGNYDSNYTSPSFGSKCYSTNFTFVMETNMNITVNFVPNKFNAAAGTYNGLFYNAISGPDMKTAGFFTLTVNADKTRSFSGKLNFPNTVTATSFKGTFSLDGTAVAAMGVNTNVYLTLPLDNASDTVTGLLASANDGLNLNSYMLADRQIVAAATNFAGNYTLALPGAGNANGSNAPDGDATATLAIDPVKGTATFNNLNFGLGTTKQLVPVVSTNGDIPFFARVNDNTTAGVSTYDGVVMGWLSVTTNYLLSPDQLSGKLTWVHTASGGSFDSYTSAFDYQNDIEASPLHTNASPLLTLTGDPLGTATLEVGGNSASIPVTNTGTWIYPVTNVMLKSVSSKGVSTYTNVPTPYAFIITAPAAKIDGHISGTFTNANISAGAPTTKYSFSGVLIQTHDHVRGSFSGDSGLGSFLIH